MPLTRLLALNSIQVIWTGFSFGRASRAKEIKKPLNRSAGPNTSKAPCATHAALRKGHRGQPVLMMAFPRAFEGGFQGFSSSRVVGVESYLFRLGIPPPLVAFRPFSRERKFIAALQNLSGEAGSEHVLSKFA